MKNTSKITLSLALALLMLLAFVGCTNEPGVTATPTPTPTVTPNGTENTLWTEAVHLENTTVGEGAKTVEVEVKAGEKSIVITIKTDATILGDALLANNIVEGENAQYGLYIKKVNGIRADYDLDGAYWAITKNGEYMMTGVDSTEIKGGEHFELTYTKG